MGAIAPGGRAITAAGAPATIRGDRGSASISAPAPAIIRAATTLGTAIITGPGTMVRAIIRATTDTAIIAPVTMATANIARIMTAMSGGVMAAAMSAGACRAIAPTIRRPTGTWPIAVSTGSAIRPIGEGHGAGRPWLPGHLEGLRSSEGPATAS